MMLGGLVVLLLAVGQAGALDAAATDPQAIMREALDIKGGERALSRMKMTIRQGSNTRERTMTVRVKRAPEQRKTLIVIEAPADVRNTGFLTIDFKARGRGDEQWLYLPALHRVSRVPSSGKSDPFVGSDFTIADLSGRDAEDYDFKLLEKSVKVGDEECWLIEGVPRSEAVKTETGYVKTQSWISKTKLIPIQLKAWTSSDNKTKYFKASEIRQVDGVWTPHRMQMRTLQNGTLSSETTIEVLDVDNNAADVSDADFTQQRLERGV
jgi:outer membrane lipoprotein-sorting protein